ncbi:hypothetical protein [uncultured Sphingomonas sp.]|jgi:hypothetical protein|uniref:hypothetical protein n=1 Tax=uncultured Sphingomonas sp. TaxID=158754 RepID=UPI00262C66A7|nr:hypothetical protein [uncultured Sphingomonas sp.]
MVADMPIASIYLMIVGGLATALAMAAMRRDGLWVLAIGLPLLLAAERAGLPPALFAWGCAGYALAVLLVAGLAAIRVTGLPLGAALVAAVALTGLSSMPAAAYHPDPAPLSLHRPPTIGVQLAAMLGTLADDPRYAD